MKAAALHHSEIDREVCCSSYRKQRADESRTHTISKARFGQKVLP